MCVGRIVLESYYAMSSAPMVWLLWRECTGAERIAVSVLSRLMVRFGVIELIRLLVYSESESLVDFISWLHWLLQCDVFFWLRRVYPLRELRCERRRQQCDLGRFFGWL